MLIRPIPQTTADLLVHRETRALSTSACLSWLIFNPSTGSGSLRASEAGHASHGRVIRIDRHSRGLIASCRTRCCRCAGLPVLDSSFNTPWSTIVLAAFKPASHAKLKATPDDIAYKRVCCLFEIPRDDSYGAVRWIEDRKTTISTIESEVNLEKIPTLIQKSKPSILSAVFSNRRPFHQLYPGALIAHRIKLTHSDRRT